MDTQEIGVNGTAIVQSEERGRQHYRSPIELLSEWDVAHRFPDASWLIEEILPEKTLVSLIGPTNSFKSFIALDWCCHIASGQKWNGRQTLNGKAVYLYAEGVTGLRQRVAAWKEFHDVVEFDGLYFQTHPLALNEAADAARLQEAIVGRAPDARLIVIDTLNRNMSGDENTAKDMGAFVMACDRLREATDATVVVVHHSGHAAGGRGRGSSALPAAVNTEIQCSRDGNRVTLTCTKQKDAPEFADYTLEAILAGDSLILQPFNLSGYDFGGQRLTVLLALRTHFGPIGARHSEWKKAAGIGDSSFDKARKWLAETGHIKLLDRKWFVSESGRAVVEKNSSVPAR
jgi:hypothetical protein